VRHHLENIILEFVEGEGIRGDTKDRPLFRSARRRTGNLTANPMTDPAEGNRIPPGLRRVNNVLITGCPP
jgi:hypothetical protein